MLKKVFHHLFYSVLQPITNCGLSRLLVGRSHFPPIFFGKKFQRESCWTSRITHGFWETTLFLIVTINESLDKWFSTRFVCLRIETSQNETLLMKRVSFEETRLVWRNETRSANVGFQCMCRCIIFFWNALRKLENWRNSLAMKLNKLCLSNRTLI